MPDTQRTVLTRSDLTDADKNPTVKTPGATEWESSTTTLPAELPTRLERYDLKENRFGYLKSDNGAVEGLQVSPPHDRRVSWRYDEGEVVVHPRQGNYLEADGNSTAI